MTRSPLRRRVGAILLLCGSLLVSSCLGGKSKPDVFYRLDLPTPTAAKTRSLPGILEIDRFRSDALLSERRIAYRPDGESGQSGRIKQHGRSYWVDSPTVLLQVGFAQALDAARVADQVVTPIQRVRPDHVLAGRILHFEGATSGTGLVELELSVTRLRDRKLIHHETYREEIPSAAKGAATTVRGVTAGVGRIVEQLVRDLAAAASGG